MGILTGRRPRNTKIIVNTVTVRLDMGDDVRNLLVHLFIAVFSVLISAVVFNGNGVGKFIVGKEFAIAVVYVATGRCDRLILFYSQVIIFLIIGTADDLQDKKTGDQYARKQNHNSRQYTQTRRKYSIRQKIFYLLKQVF